MSMRLPIVLMLTALGCAVPAMAGPPKSGDAPIEDSPKDGPKDDRAQSPGEEPPAHDEPEADEGQPKGEPGADGEDGAGKGDEGKGDEGKGDEGKGDEGSGEPGEEEPPPKPEPPKPPAIELSEPEFINGDVPSVSNILKKTLADVAKCVTDHGGLEADQGRLKMQFLVRGRGRAEGVEVLERRGVSADAGRCVQKLLKNKWVGMPTQDPTGVVFRYDMKKK